MRIEFTSPTGLVPPVAVVADREESGWRARAALAAHGIELASLAAHTRDNLRRVVGAPGNPTVGDLSGPGLTAVVDTLMADPSVATVLLVGRPPSATMAADLRTLSSWHQVILAYWAAHTTRVLLRPGSGPSAT